MKPEDTMSDRGKTKIRKEDANYVMFNLVRKKPKFDEAVLQCCHDLGSERTPRNLAEALFGSEALNTVARGCVEKELQHTATVELILREETVYTRFLSTALRDTIRDWLVTTVKSAISDIVKCDIAFETRHVSDPKEAKAYRKARYRACDKLLTCLYKAVDKFPRNGRVILAHAFACTQDKFENRNSGDLAVGNLLFLRAISPLLASQKAIEMAGSGGGLRLIRVSKLLQSLCNSLSQDDMNTNSGANADDERVTTRLIRNHHDKLLLFLSKIRTTPTLSTKVPTKSLKFDRKRAVIVAVEHVFKFCYKRHEEMRAILVARKLKNCMSFLSSVTNGRYAAQSRARNVSNSSSESSEHGELALLSDCKDSRSATETSDDTLDGSALSDFSNASSLSEISEPGSEMSEDDFDRRFELLALEFDEGSSDDEESFSFSDEEDSATINRRSSGGTAVRRAVSGSSTSNFSGNPRSLSVSSSSSSSSKPSKVGKSSSSVTRVRQKAHPNATVVRRGKGKVVRRATCQGFI